MNNGDSNNDIKIPNYTFNKQTDGMIENLFIQKDNIRSIFQEHVYQRKKFQESDSRRLNISPKHMSTLNMFVNKQFYQAILIFLYVSTGLGYCIMYTRKLKKLKVPLTKSLYAWGGITLSSIVVSNFIEKKLTNNFDDLVENMLIDSLFLGDREDDKKKKLIRNQLKFYKSLNGIMNH
jgi:hypothetical protein